MVSRPLDDETASRVRDYSNFGICTAEAWCKAQRGQAEYDRLAALCINTGRSRPPARLCLQRLCKMPSSVRAFSVVAALQPLLKERVDDHRQIMADEKSPHDGLRAFVDRWRARSALVLIYSRHRQHSLQDGAEANQYHEQLQQICKSAVGGKPVDGPKADCANDDNGQNRD